MIDMYIGMAKLLAENSLHLAEPTKELEYCIERIDDNFLLSKMDRECMINTCAEHINRVRYNINEDNN